MSTVKSEPPRDALASLRIDRSSSANQHRRSSGWFRKLVTLVVIILILIGGYFGAVKSGFIEKEFAWLKVPEAIQNLPQVRVETVAIQRGRSGDATVVATGYLESRRQAKIGARAAGRIQVLNVEEGSRVTKDQEIAILEHSDMDAVLAAQKASMSRATAALAEQEITISQAQRDLDRAKQLWKSKSISEAEYEQSTLAYDAAVARRQSLNADLQLAEARVREAQQLLENMYIRAPFDGTVISKDAEVGESILPGGMGEASGRGSVVTIADLEHLEVDCDVKEDYISRVFEDQPTEVVVDAVPDRRYRGRVRKIIPMGDRARATIKVKVEILDVSNLLFPDMSSTVYFLPTETEAVEAEKARVFCSANAVVEREQTKIVWKMDQQNRVNPVMVETGVAKDGRIEILSGLVGGERIVTNPPSDGLKPGQLVKLSE
jgi:RND family efflux transporter MFP subunit